MSNLLKQYKYTTHNNLTNQMAFNNTVLKKVSEQTV